MVPFIIRYCRPEAVNDNDARARRGEGRTGRTRRAETSLAGTECTVGVAVVVVAGLDRGWTLELGPLTF